MVQYCLRWFKIVFTITVNHFESVLSYLEQHVFMNNYLDINKSIIISAPAGSGKTEKLARRYIALIQEGVDVERILAITFTDKAAAEMKQRILRILKEEDKELFELLLKKMPLIRVSTIHSFCGTLLRRFSFEATVDPGYKVEEAIDSGMVWEEMLYEVLMEAGKGQEGHEFLLEILGERGFRGLNYLKGSMDYLFQKNPFSLKADIFSREIPSPHHLIDELKSWQGVSGVLEGYEEFFDEGYAGAMSLLEKYFLTERKEPRKKPVPLLKNIVDYRDWASKMHLLWKYRKSEEHTRRAQKLKEIFHICYDKYTDRKRARGTLDFSDLEYLAYRMLTENPEWANILYAFDEKTDHILVDEFQDTNTFQWEIINKLTEEWRSGLGAKREEGVRPTLFFVGDEKQSIYYFRGANVEIFNRARENLQEWLGDEFHYEEVKENFRSLPVIIDFTNQVFSKIMQTGPHRFAWITGYSPFHAYRTGKPDAGRVELILLDDDAENVSEAKQKEAEVLARRIRGLRGNYHITDRGSGHERPCNYMDMAVLLRKRTHLKIYEEALRRYHIPFVAVKGIGFYQEPEIAVLRALVYFLSNPADDYSLYVLLKSPLFNFDEGTIIQLINNEGDCLFSKMKNYSTGEAAALLEEWLGLLPLMPVAELIERVLVRTGAWRHFYEAQRRANIKKFIRIIEDLEASGKSLLRIRDFLERTYDRNDEPKANVNTEGMDAVKIMTVHAAKGLEFPVVFLPGLEEPFTTAKRDSLVYEKDGRFFFKSVPEPSLRKEDEDFHIHQAREEEEQKRLFYVAVTRAEEALFLTGQWSSRDKNFLSFIKNGLGLERKNRKYRTETDIQGLSILTEDDVKTLYDRAACHKGTAVVPGPVKVIPTPVIKSTPWKAVTSTVEIKKRHGKDWLVLGDIIHRIFEGIAKGVLVEGDIYAQAARLLESRGIRNEQKQEKIEIIEKDISMLKQKKVWQDIISPRENSYAELPFVLETDDVIYTGRIDRLIIEKGTYKIYDYKTFPVRENEKASLIKEYSHQLNLYKKAVRSLFNTEDARSYIVFTHTGEIREI